MSFGIIPAYKQNKLNQFVEYLLDHQDIFSEEIINTQEFQEGMVVFLDQYFKLRSKEKLKLAQNIFLDFAKSPKMPIYPLERFDDTLQKISESGIQFLGFIDSEVPKLKRDHALYKANQNGNNIDMTNLQNLIRIYSNEPINFFIEKYVEKCAMEQMRNYEGDEPLTEENRIKKQLLEPFEMLKGELEQLGLAKINYTEGQIGGGGREYFNLTDYGLKFVLVIHPDEVYQPLS
jgi:hypothetical protein